MFGSKPFNFNFEDFVRVLERALWAGLAAFVLFLVQTGIPDLQAIYTSGFEAMLLSLVAGLLSAAQRWMQDTRG